MLRLDNGQQAYLIKISDELKDITYNPICLLLIISKVLPKQLVQY